MNSRESSERAWQYNVQLLMAMVARGMPVVFQPPRI
jgi:hypothetical protein